MSGAVVLSKRALIVSLRFAPGLVKEFVTIGRHLKDSGWEVTYAVTSAYRSQMEELGATEAVYLDVPESRARAFAGMWRGFPQVLDEALGGQRFDYVSVYNPHPLNTRAMSWARRSAHVPVRSVVLHEPWVPLAERGRYGWKGVLKLLAVDLFSQTLLRQCTDVILPSPHAEELYAVRPLTPPVRQHMIPLCIPDRGADTQAAEAASDEYICFVGTINPARRVDDVFRLADELRASGSDVQVRVLTRSHVDEFPPNAVIDTRESISDDDISDLVAGALAVFLPHTAASQSGNVPVAFNVGTPAIVHDIRGLTQYVRDGETGVVLSGTEMGEVPGDLLDKLRDPNVRSNCRAAYEAHFSPRTLGERYSWLTSPDGAPGS